MCPCQKLAKFNFVLILGKMLILYSPQGTLDENWLPQYLSFGRQFGKSDLRRAPDTEMFSLNSSTADFVSPFSTLLNNSAFTEQLRIAQTVALASRYFVRITGVVAA